MRRVIFTLHLMKENHKFGIQLVNEAQSIIVTAMINLPVTTSDLFIIIERI